MRKKAQGLSLNTIVLAAIVLIVLVVLVIVFSGKIGGFRQGVNSCSGECVEKSSDCSETENPLYIIGCDANGDGKADGGNFCCTPI